MNYKKDRNSGGVTVFVKHTLISNDLIKRVFSNFDDCIVLLLNGKLLNLENDIIFCFTYISPEGSPIYDDITGNNGIEKFENKLFEIVSHYPDAGIVLAGDFNARCGEVKDITIDDTVDFIFDENVVYESDNFLQYKNMQYIWVVIDRFVSVIWCTFLKW